VEGVWEMGIPVSAAVGTSIIAYLPLAFIQGIMGKFIAILPITAIGCLIVSLVESMVMLPAHLSHLPEPHAIIKSHGPIMTRIHQFHRSMGHGLEWFAGHIYVPLLRMVLRWRYCFLSCGIGILLLTIGMVRGGILQIELFPDMDGFIISSAVEFPEGTPTEVTENAVQELREAMMRINNRSETRSGDPLIINLMTTVGNIPDDDPGGIEDDMSLSHLGGVQAILLEAEKRGIHTKDLLIAWEKEAGPIDGVNALTFFSTDVGPPNEPIEIGIQGHNMDTILAAARRLMEYLRRFEGVSQVRCDFMTGKDEIRFRLRPEASTLGLTVNDIAGQLHAAYYGEDSSPIQRGRDDIKVRVRYDREERNRISSLGQVRIHTPDGEKVPLMSLASAEYGPGKGTITRVNGQKHVTVRANIDDRQIHSDEIIDRLSIDFFQTASNDYPGIRFILEGEEEEEAETFDSLIVGFPLAILGIFLVLATMFRSYVQPFIILFTIPFGIIGAVAGHLILGHSLSLLSIFGMVAMSGVVVNDAIVLIERINRNLTKGEAFFEAIETGCKRRFRAVFLTSISTVGGLAPLIMETNQHAQMIIPIAISIAAGLSFATVLTLFLIPSLIAILNDFRVLLNRIRYGVWPEREKVEPVISRTIRHFP
jgi:multidrug efflux pump subunit AcrB